MAQPTRNRDKASSYAITDRRNPKQTKAPSLSVADASTMPTEFPESNPLIAGVGRLVYRSQPF